MTNKDTATDVSAQALDDTDLDGAQGGVGLLLPAVQSAREAARRTKPAPKDLGNFEIQD